MDDKNVEPEVEVEVDQIQEKVFGEAVFSRQRLELETGLERADLRDVTVEHRAHVAYVVPSLL